MTTQGYKGTVNNASERFCRISLQLTDNQLEWKWCTLRYAHFVWTGWIVVAGKRSCIYCTWLAKKKNSRDPSEQNKMYSIDKMFFWNKKKRLRCDMILDTWIFLYLSGHRFYQLITYIKLFIKINLINIHLVWMMKSTSTIKTKYYREWDLLQMLVKELKNTKTNELSNLNYTNVNFTTHLPGFVCEASITCSFQIYSRILVQVRHFLSFLNMKKN